VPPGRLCRRTVPQVPSRVKLGPQAASAGDCAAAACRSGRRTNSRISSNVQDEALQPEVTVLDLKWPGQRRVSESGPSRWHSGSGEPDSWRQAGGRGPVRAATRAAPALAGQRPRCISMTFIRRTASPASHWHLRIRDWQAAAA
jgi:hypothetical protein